MLHAQYHYVIKVVIQKLVIWSNSFSNRLFLIHPFWPSLIFFGKQNVLRGDAVCALVNFWHVSLHTISLGLLPSATKLRRLCFYTCLSFCPRGGGVLPQCMLGYHPPSRPPPGADPPPPRSRHTARSRHPPGADTPQEQISPETATVADGTHPTGMHSCLISIYFVYFLCTSKCKTSRSKETLLWLNLAQFRIN